MKNGIKTPIINTIHFEKNYELSTFVMTSNLLECNRFGKF